MNTNKKTLLNIDENFDDAIETAVKIYLEGKVFVYPTDTIYGMGANPFNNDAVSKINFIKEREAGKQYIFLINDIKNLLKYVELKSERHLDFLAAIWPNTISVVMPLNKKTSEILETKTVAFRIPNNKFCAKLTARLNMPLLSTSVNRSSNPPLNDFSQIETEFGEKVDAIFYTDKKIYSQASTIIELGEKEPKLIREGKIKFTDILEKF
jgi:L-threonylcarbamoyladenylate synthase